MKLDVTNFSTCNGKILKLIYVAFGYGSTLYLRTLKVMASTGFGAFGS